MKIEDYVTFDDKGMVKFVEGVPVRIACEAGLQMGYDNQRTVAKINDYLSTRLSVLSDQIETLTNRICNLEKLHNTEPEVFMQQMRALIDENSNDPEQLHIHADDLICDLLKTLGFGEAVKLFENAPKWYS